MTYSYPGLDVEGWHFEVGWYWNTFGVIASVTWDQSVVLRLGWAYVMFWKFDRSPEMRDWLSSDRAGCMDG